MKTNKIIIVITAFICVALGTMPVAQAALSSGENLTVSAMDPVGFYLYDLNGDDTATLNASTFSVGQNPDYNLEFSTDGTSYSVLNTYTTISYGSGSELAQVYFRLVPINGNASPIKTGDVTFQNHNFGESNAAGLDLYHAFSVGWDSGQFTVTFSSSDDRFSPVPIPASVLLLGTGLIGLIGFRRQMKKR
jgi:hypothetical protein